MKQRVWLSFVVLMGMLVLPLAGRGQWVQTSSFTPGAVTAFAGNSSGQYCVAGGQLYSLDNASDTWYLDGNAPGSIIVGVAVNGSDPFVATEYDGIYGNVGLSGKWTSCNAGLPNSFPSSIISSQGILFVGLDGDGVFESTDHGNTWTASNTGLKSLNIKALAEYIGAASDTNLIVGTSDGVFLSSDKGATWRPTGDLPFPFVSRVGSNGSTLYYGTWEGVGGLFRSTNNGTTWETAGGGLPDTKIHAIAGVNGNVFVGTEKGLFESTDNGNAWEQRVSVTADRINAIVPLDVGLFAGTSDGCFKSTDYGYSWSAYNKGMNIASLTVGALYVHDSLLVAGAGDADAKGTGVFQTTNGGKTWSGSDAGLPTDTLATGRSTDGVIGIAANGSLMFAAMGYGEVYKSTDNGLSWNEADSGFVEIKPYYNVTALACIGPNVIAGRNDHNYFESAIYLSTDSGKNWSPPAQYYSLNFPLAESVVGLDVIGTRVYACMYDSIFLSTDSGKSWNAISQSLAGNNFFSGVTMIGTKLFAVSTSSQHVYCSTDDGVDWTEVSSDLPRYTEGYISLASYGSNLFIGTFDAGVYVSTNGGVHWSPANRGLGNLEIRSLAVQDSTLYAGTYRGEVWKCSIPAMTASLGISSLHSIPSEIHSYPNPFSQSTTISFTAEVPSYAEIRIVNQLGAEVARMFAGELSKGEHTFTWNVPSRLAPGMYECVVRMNGEMQRTAIILSK